VFGRALESLVRKSRSVLSNVNLTSYCKKPMTPTLNPAAPTPKSRSRLVVPRPKSCSGISTLDAPKSRMSWFRPIVNWTSLVGVGAFLTSKKTGGLRITFISATGLNAGDFGSNIGSLPSWLIG